MSNAVLTIPCIVQNIGDFCEIELIVDLKLERLAEILNIYHDYHGVSLEDNVFST